MYVKGIAFLSRETQLKSMFGADTWETFMSVLKQECAYFEQTVYQTAKIPLHDFLRFQELAIAHFFKGDLDWYFKLGEASAKWSLSKNGPFGKLFEQQDFRQFLAYGPQTLWRSYYDFGSIKVWEETPGTVHAQVRDLPVMHPHFELGVMGYVQGVVETFTGKTPVYEKTPLPDEAASIYYIFKY
jgi:hypothetical protein